LGKDSNCRCLEFYTDLTQLCEGCPLKKLIPEGIQTQIVAEAEDNRELMPPNQFRQWIEGQISAATAVMQQMRIDAMHPAEHYPNVLTEHFIWNKERAKALRRFIGEPEPMKAEPERLPEFAELTGPITQALKQLQLLSDTGRYIGKKGQIKTLFNALERKGYLVGDRSTTEQFSKYFQTTFGGKVTGRALRDPLTIDQEEDLPQYKAALPKKISSQSSHGKHGKHGKP
jgi:DNA-binding PadR family transcriptional regulator